MNRAESSHCPETHNIRITNRPHCVCQAQRHSKNIDLLSSHPQKWYVWRALPYLRLVAFFVSSPRFSTASTNGLAPRINPLIPAVQFVFEPLRFSFTQPLRIYLDHAMANKSSQQTQASTNYKEAFSLFDKRGNGRVPRDSLGDLLRACGQNPTLSEIRDLETSMGGDCMFTLLTTQRQKSSTAHQVRRKNRHRLTQ